MSERRENEKKKLVGGEKEGIKEERESKFVI